MRDSVKTKRLKRHHRRNKQQGKLNLVSLMDIFTILVFFLMVNSSSEVRVLDPNSSITLPSSTAQQTPKDVLALVVTDENILVNGRPIVKREVLDNLEGTVEPALKAELDYLAERSLREAPATGRPITILADRELPYELLKKIMATCVEAGYASISLAVSRATEERGA